MNGSPRPRPLFLSLAGVVVLTVLPAGAATLPATCGDPCVVAGGGFGFVPPAVSIASGASVTWQGLDTTHVNREGTGAMPAQPSCFDVEYSSGEESLPVRFDVTAQGLTATVLAVTETCGTAEALPDGSFAVPYFCVLHSATMRGVVVVLA